MESTSNDGDVATVAWHYRWEGTGNTKNYASGNYDRKVQGIESSPEEVWLKLSDFCLHQCVVTDWHLLIHSVGPPKDSSLLMPFHNQVAPR